MSPASGSPQTPKGSVHGNIPKWNGNLHETLCLKQGSSLHVNDEEKVGGWGDAILHNFLKIGGGEIISM